MNEKKIFRNFLWKQSIFGLGMANGLLTVVIFYLKLRKGFEDIWYQELFSEIMITSVVIGLSVAVIGSFLTRREMRRGKLASFSGRNIINYIVPNEKPFQAFIITIYTVIVTMLITVITFLIQGEQIFNFKVFLVDVFVICSLASAFTAMVSIIKTVHAGAVPINNR